MMERTNLVQMRVGEVQVDTVQAVQLEASIVDLEVVQPEVLDLQEELVVRSDLKEELEDWDQDKPQEVAVTSTKPIESSW